MDAGRNVILLGDLNIRCRPHIDTAPGPAAGWHHPKQRHRHPGCTPLPVLSTATARRDGSPGCDDRMHERRLIRLHPAPAWATRSACSPEPIDRPDPGDDFLDRADRRLLRSAMTHTCAAEGRQGEVGRMPQGAHAPALGSWPPLLLPAHRSVRLQPATAMATHSTLIRSFTRYSPACPLRLVPGGVRLHSQDSLMPGRRACCLGGVQGWLVDAFRLHHPGRRGAYTCWSAATSARTHNW